MGFIVEFFTGILSGANYGDYVTQPFDDLEHAPDLGIYIMMLDVEQIMPINQFKERAADYIRMVKATKKAPGFSEIFVPGEIEWAREGIIAKEGLNIDDKTYQIIKSRGF